MNFRYKIAEFMRGRYGRDTLGDTLIISAISLAVINLFLRNMLVQAIVYAFIAFEIFRLFSRNIYARQKENKWFLSKVSFLKRRREILAQRKADINHVYKKCPECHVMLKLPYRVGKHKTVCPKCSKEFKVRVRKRK